MMTPPSSGPIASAIAETPAQIPIAIPRSRGGNVAEMIESVAGIISAAPTPWTARAAISSVAPAGEAARERREREDDEAEHEDQPPAEQVAELAAGEQQRPRR